MSAHVNEKGNKSQQANTNAPRLRTRRENGHAHARIRNSPSSVPIAAPKLSFGCAAIGKGAAPVIIDELTVHTAVGAVSKSELVRAAEYGWYGVPIALDMIQLSIITCERRESRNIHDIKQTAAARQRVAKFMIQTHTREKLGEMPE